MLTLTHDGRNRIAISHLSDFFLVSQMTNGNPQLKSCGRSNTIPEYIYFYKTGSDWEQMCRIYATNFKSKDKK